jgi:glycosyltransferase involved in cell wall biosynthesis
VYLINDKSDYDYSSFVSFFSEYYSIKEIKLKNNMGPGGARREGNNKSKSKFIMFIDSDDMLYDSVSLYNLYNTINHSSYDVVISNFILERDNVRIIEEKNHIFLHGKIYRRSFLKKNNITFNDSRANEDNGFNRLIIFLNAKIGYSDIVTYLYKENPKSITRNNNRSYKIDGLEGFVYNMKWAIEETKKRGKSLETLPDFSYAVLMSLYYDYLSFIKEKNVNKILEYAKEILPYYLPNKDKVSPFVPEMVKNNKEKECKSLGRNISYEISFDEFLERSINYD